MPELYRVALTTGDVGCWNKLAIAWGRHCVFEAAEEEMRERKATRQLIMAERAASRQRRKCSA